MQCLSCRFENRPGLASCARCGTTLDFRALEIDVHPPRAGRNAKRLRQLTPRSSLYRTRDAVSSAFRRFSGTVIEDAKIPIPSLPVFFRLIVPGWAHFYCGFQVLGGLFLAAYLVLFALGLLLWGMQAGAICTGLAFSVHASSAVDVLIRQRTVRFPSMVATAGVVWLALGLGVYAPIAWVLSRLAETRMYDYDAPPFQRFDVVLCNRWAFAWNAPRPGDVVVLSAPSERNIATGPRQGHVEHMVREAEVVDRVLGRPGDRVIWENKTLSLNGVAVPWRPLVPEKLPPQLDLTVPEGRYLILPTASAGLSAATPPTTWREIGFFPAESIRGGAYLRLPLTRLWFIR